MYMGKVKSCLVLMSTYNGEKYLQEQIDSVLNQTDIDVTLWVADDCSSDATVDILENYQNKHSNFRYKVNSANKNFTYNFIDLLFNAKDEEFDYYAFCDQDDVWETDKLSAAIKKIEGSDRKNRNGVFYCSNQTLVDAQLNYIGLKYTKSPLYKNRYVHIFENIATGCTIVFDRQYKDYVCEYYPQNIYLHDHYLFMLAWFTATVVYDEQPHINYRQHDGNVIGVRKPSFMQRLKKFVKQNRSQSVLPREILAGYSGQIAAEDLKYLSMVAEYRQSFIKRMRLFFTFKVHPKSHYFNYRIKILLGKL